MIQTQYNSNQEMVKRLYNGTVELWTNIQTVYNPATNTNEETATKETVQAFIGKFNLDEIKASNNTITYKHKKILVLNTKNPEKIKIDSTMYRIDFRQQSIGYTVIGVIKI